MASKYQSIKELMSFWEEYEAKENQPSLEKFAHWLLHRFSLKQEQVAMDESAGTDRLNTSIKLSIIDSIARLARLTELNTKKMFNGLPLHNLLEYGFLSSINKNSSSNKTDIIAMHLVEYTSGIEIIKRLEKLILIEIYDDVIDKRRKKMRITSEGKRVLLDAMLRMNEIFNQTYKELDEHKQLVFNSILQEIEYLQHSNQTKVNK
jgi:DNA-binding MarR family transcriptional regulator